MRLITKALLKRFAELGTQEDQDGDPLLVAHFFNPAGSGDWYAVSYDPESEECFGWVSWLEDEWGYFSITELESVRIPPGFQIERDLYWEEVRFSQLNKS